MAPRKLTHELLREIVNLRAAENTFAEIALLTGVSEGAIATWRRRGRKEPGLAGDLTRLLDKIEQEKKARQAKQRKDVFNRRVEELRTRYEMTSAKGNLLHGQLPRS